MTASVPTHDLNQILHPEELRRKKTRPSRQGPVNEDKTKFIAISLPFDIQEKPTSFK